MARRKGQKPGVKKAGAKKSSRQKSKTGSAAKARPVAESATTSVLSGPMKDAIREAFLHRG